MKEGRRGTSSAPLVTHLDRCLGCMACVTACPSGVQYDKLIEDTRAAARAQLRAPAARARAPAADLRAVHEARAAARARARGGARAEARPPAARTPAARAPAGAAARRAMISMTPETSVSALARAPAGALRGSRGEARDASALLQGCVQRVFFAHVNEATARVLAAEGFEVHVPRAAALLRRAPAARRRGHRGAGARKGDDRGVRGLRPVIVNAAGCGSAMKDYGHVLRDEPEWAERAARVLRSACGM